MTDAAASLAQQIEALRNDLHTLATSVLPDLVARQRYHAEALDRIHFRLNWPRGVFPPGNTWAAAPDMLLEVVNWALDNGPEVAVECGSGTSTVALARCMQLAGRGHVYSLEQDADHVALTRRNLAIAGVADYATVIQAPLQPYSFYGEDHAWYALADLPERPIDILLVDGPVGRHNMLVRYPAGPLLITRLTDRGVVFLDDLKRQEERRCFARWRLEHPALKASVRETERGLGILSAG